MKSFRKKTCTTPGTASRAAASGEAAASCGVRNVWLRPSVRRRFTTNFNAFTFGVGCTSTMMDSVIREPSAEANTEIVNLLNLLDPPDSPDSTDPIDPIDSSYALFTTAATRTFDAAAYLLTGRFA